MKKFSMIVGAVLFGMLGYAQYTDFTGTWNFKDQESISGNLLDNGSPTQMKVAQGKLSMVIGKITEGGNVNTTTEDTVGFDGKPFETIAPSGRRKSMTLKWSDDRKSFSETTRIFSVLDTGKLEYIVTDRWTMEGKTLVFVRKDENLMMGEIWESKAYYDKL